VRTALLSLAVIVTIGALIVFVGPLLISSDHVRDKAFAKVEAATGYRLRVSGPVKIAFLPSLDLVAEDVGIAQPEASGAAEFATARALRLGLRLGPLLSGKVRMTEVTLVDPIVTLPLPSRPAPDAAGNGEGEPDGRVRDLSLDRFVIRNGTVVLAASGGQPGEKITGLMLEASLPSVSGPLAFEGAADFDGNKVKTAGSIGSFVHFLSGGPAPIRLTVEAPAYLPEGATLSATATYKDATLTLAQLAARSGKHAIAGNAIYQDETLSITQGTFDNTPFAGRAHLGDDTLTVDARAAIEGKPVRVTGVISTFDRFLGGDAAPIQLTVDAPDHLPAEAIIAGTAMYKDDSFALTEFTATSGEDVLSGTATYKDDVLSLSQFTAKSGNRTFSGNATYKDNAVTVDLTVGREDNPAQIAGSIADIDKLLAGQPAPIKLVVDAPTRLPAKASIEGNAAYKEDTVILAEFTAVSGTYTLTGNGTYKDDTLMLDPITTNTGGEILSGKVTANLAGDVPSIGATLTATSSGKGEFAASANGVQKAPAESPDGTASTPNNAPASPPGTENQAQAPTQATENALATPGGAGETEVGVTPPAGDEAAPASAARAGEAGSVWSGDNINFSLLKAVNANLNLTVNQLAYDGIKIDAAIVKAALSGGKLTAEIPSLRAYGGGGSATLTINVNGEVPVHRLKLTLDNLAAYPFLRDVVDFQTIEGKGAIVLDLTASGASDRAVFSSMNGTASFGFTDGALRGLNVAKMLRSLTTGILTGWQFDDEAKTVFKKFGASFKIASGQGQTDDLRLIGPLVSVGGAGTVDLPAQRLKFRVNPFMLASVEGPGGKNRMLGFPVPIGVSGPWDRPLIYPDIVGVLESPVAAYQQFNKLGGGLIAMPAGLLGIDTGEGGLVEKGVAIPTAITKGVVGGIGQVLGIKKPESAPPQGEAAAPGETAVPPEGEAAPRAAEPAPTDAPTAAATTDPALQAETAAPVTAAQVPSKKEKAPEAAPNQMLENMFGN
jgi:AsmA protein